jgi:CRP/FNR family cyclic AMP-dependent transcriptional regulator
MDPKRLQSITLFEGLSKKEIESLSQAMDEVELPEGKELATEGRFAYEFFIIEDGTASVTRGGERVQELGPGDFFGEIALLEAERRTASVVTTSPMNAIVMTRRDFHAMEKNLPQVGQQIREKLQERLAADRER